MSLVFIVPSLWFCMHLHICRYVCIWVYNKVSRTLLSVLADFSIAFFWIISILPQILNPLCHFRFQGSFQGPPTTTSTNKVQVFFSLLFPLLSRGWQVLLFMVIKTSSDLMIEIWKSFFISESQSILRVSFSGTDSIWFIYYMSVRSNLNF